MYIESIYRHYIEKVYREYMWEPRPRPRARVRAQAWEAPQARARTGCARKRKYCTVAPSRAVRRHEFPLYGARDIKIAALDRAPRTFYSSGKAHSPVNASLGRHRLGNHSRTCTVRFDFEVFTICSRAYSVFRYSAESCISARIRV